MITPLVPPVRADLHFFWLGPDKNTGIYVIFSILEDILSIYRKYRNIKKLYFTRFLFPDHKQNNPKITKKQTFRHLCQAIMKIRAPATGPQPVSWPEAFGVTANLFVLFPCQPPVDFVSTSSRPLPELGGLIWSQYKTKIRPIYCQYRPTKLRLI